MSWALEEWKEGLPTRALQKIQELEGQLDKLKKERQQRQFQLETLEAALQKQKQKVLCNAGARYPSLILWVPCFILGSLEKNDFAVLEW